MLTLSRLTALGLILATKLALAQSYHVHSITTEDGLLSNQVNSVVQDNSGKLWISTVKGLTKYDGLQWEDFPDSLTVPISTDTRLQKLPDGRILVAGHTSLDRFIALMFSTNEVQKIDVPLADSKFKKYWGLTEQSGHLYLHVYYEDTIHSYSFDEKKWRLVALPENLHQQVTKVLGYQDEFFILSRLGLYKMEGSNFKRITPESVPGIDLTIHDMVMTDTVTYLLGRKWLGELRDGDLTILLDQSHQPSVAYNQLKLNRNGFLFFRTETRFEWFHLASRDHLRFTADNDDAIPMNSTLFIDQENNLWVTSYRGLHKFSSFQFLGFTPNSGLLEYEVSSIEEMAPNKFFIGGQRSYAILENRAITYRSFTSENPQSKSRMISIAKDGRNKLFLAGQELGLGELQPNMEVKWKRLPEGYGELVFYANDSIFVSTQNGIIFSYVNNKFQRYVNVQAYPRNIYLLDDGAKLVCSSSGLRIIRGKQVEAVSVPNNVLLRSVYCMFTVDGIHYLGTDAGLARLDGDKIVPTKIFGTSVSFPIYAVRKVSDEAVWFGSDKGVMVVTPSGIQSFGDEDGLLGTEINRRAFITASSGEVLVGTNKGLNIYDQKMTFLQSQVFPPSIVSVEVGNQIVKSPWEKIELVAGNSNLRINISSITFSRQPVSFRYRMQGFEEEWSLLSSEDLRQIQYRNLPSGQYQFELQSRLGANPWTPSVISPPIIIKESFYSSWPFFALIFLVAVAIGFLVNRIITQFTMNKTLRETVQSKIKEIEINEAKLQLALENSRMGVWTYNFDTKAVDHTRQIFEILRMSDNIEPLEVKDYIGLVHPEDKMQLTEALNDAIKSRQTFDAEMRLRLANGDYHWTLAKGRCIYHDNGKPYMLSGTLADIHERKEYEADREKLIFELEQTNRELDRFVYSASHDLSAPMKSVMGLINLAKMNASPSETQNYLSLIDKSIRKQDEFIKEIISFARNTRTNVEIEQINLEELLEETLSNLRYADHYAQSEFNIVIDEDCRVIPGDRTRFKIVLNNLLSNAIKFQRKDVDKHVVMIKASRSRDVIRIQIEDNGEGIRQEHTQRIFDMFYRATDNAPGSGLGLYIAKEAVSKMGGEISFESTFGVGSKFTITLKMNGQQMSTVSQT